MVQHRRLHSSHLALGVLLVAAASCGLLWGPVAGLNVKLSGVNYDFRQGPDWDSNRCKAPPKVFREMRLLQTVTNRVRIYSLSDCNVRPVLEIAKNLNMTVWLGVWVGNETKVFEKEYRSLQRLIGEGLLSTDVVAGVNVGSEALYRNDTTVTELLGNFETIKKYLTEQNITVPMSITDTLGMLSENPKIVEAVDVVTFNIFPFWNKIPIDSGVKDLEKAVESFANVTKDKPFIITETGWAADGMDKKASTASPENAARYMKEFYLLAEEKDWKYYYFAGFDTPYRKKAEKDPDTVEAWFGIFSESGAMNAHYGNLTIPANKMPDGLVTPLNDTSPTTPPDRASGVAAPSHSPLQFVLALVAMSTILMTHW